MKQFFFLNVILFFLIAQAYSETKPPPRYIKNMFCSTYYADLYLDSVLDLGVDKIQHCALSCQVALKCSLFSTTILGLAKEAYDILGPGNAEWKDLSANFQGIILSYYVSTNKQCINRCKIIYSNY